jgi:hypothetical protein
MIEWFGFAKLAEQLVELLKKLRSEGDRRDKEASAYFQQLSAAMEAVVENLRKDQVPRISGNEMNTLIHAFPTKTKGVFSSQEASETKTLLSDAAITAKTLDAYILENTPSDPAEREQRLAVLERIAGHCRALAGILSKP